MKTGTVYLVGAGPGDPGLLTLKGKACLETADTVVGDYLADSRLLRHMNRSAEYIYAGKQSGRHAMTQEEIGALLVKRAKEGKTVVRLKGGDPFVFGRGGEEIEALRDGGVPFEEVPGVTSAVAAPAYAGIPVTHRGLASSFAVVTGHEDPTKEESALRWKALATATDTIVFLMGVSHIDDITERLMRYGRGSDTPAAFIRWGTRPYQETVVTTVGRAAQDAVRFRVRPPAVFVVGEVVSCRENMRWFEDKPLFGKRILVTRTRKQASKMTDALEAAGACCREIPVIRTAEPSDGYASLDRAISALPSYQWIVFTSQNGADAFFRRLFENGRDVRALGSLKIAAIGSETAKALFRYGLRVDCMPHAYKAEELADAMKRMAKPGERILVPRAKEARAVLCDELRAFGCETETAEAYHTVPDEESREEMMKILESKEADIVTFTSSSTVKHFMDRLRGREELLEDVELACIGPVTADMCRAYGREPSIVAEVFTVEGLAAALRKEYGK